MQTARLCKPLLIIRQPLLSCRVSADDPESVEMTPIATDLNVRRHLRRAVATGITVAFAVFVVFAYLPGTDESLLYWGGLAVVLAFAISGLVATVLILHAVYRQTQRATALDRDRRPSPPMLAVVSGLVGWIAIPVLATIVVEQPTTAVRLGVALLTGEAIILVVGGLGIRFTEALTLDHTWRPRAALLAAITYTVILAAPAVGCGSNGLCLGTPDRLVAAVLGVNSGLAPLAYLVISLGVGIGIGSGLAVRDVSPSHGFFAGSIAAASTLPLVAATSTDPGVVRTTALYLPLLLGTISAVAGAVVFRLVK